MNSDLTRFLDAQNQTYLRALSEIKNGKKESHWMWYIFPQLKGLGKSEMAHYYGLNDLKEAESFLSHPILGKHLLEISETLLSLNDKTATQVFGNPDDLKLKSCMTLFNFLQNSEEVFEKVLKKYFNGTQDELTLKLLSKNQIL